MPMQFNNTCLNARKAMMMILVPSNNPSEKDYTGYSMYVLYVQKIMQEIENISHNTVES